MLAIATARRALVIIDMTVGQWDGISFRKNETLATIERLAANRYFDLVIDSHLALPCTPPTQETICEITWPKAAAAEALLPSLQAPHVQFVSKHSYSSEYTYSSTSLNTSSVSSADVSDSRRVGYRGTTDV